jgi:hypothetical protein
VDADAHATVDGAAERQPCGLGASGSGKDGRNARQEGGAALDVAAPHLPNQVAVGAGGTLYVSVNSTCPAVGAPFPYCAAGGTLVKLTKS